MHPEHCEKPCVSCLEPCHFIHPIHKDENKTPQLPSHCDIIVRNKGLDDNEFYNLGSVWEVEQNVYRAVYLKNSFFAPCREDALQEGHRLVEEEGKVRHYLEDFDTLEKAEAAVLEALGGILTVKHYLY